MHNKLLALFALILLASAGNLVAQEVGADRGPALGMRAADYSFGYWLNGWRKQSGDQSPDLLCFESGYFGFVIDPATLDRPRFGRFADGMDYLGCLQGSGSRVANLKPAELAVEVSAGGMTYRMVSCKAGEVKGPGRLQTVRMWESGKWVQHYDVQDLIFKDPKGEVLGCKGTLDLVAWPGSLTINAELSPDVKYEDGRNRGVSGAGWCVIDKPVDIPQQEGLDPKVFSAECWVNVPESLAGRGQGWLLCKNNHEERDGNFGFLLQGGKFAATMNVGGGKAHRHSIEAKRPPTSGEWSQLALTYDGKTMSFYVNGVAQGATAIDAPRTPGKGLLRVGKRADNLGTPVPALYDQVRIWNRALSAKEVAEHARRPDRIADRAGLAFEENFEPNDGSQYEPPVWKDAGIRARFTAGEKTWQNETRVAGVWKSGERHGVTLNCDIEPSYTPSRNVTIRLSTPDGQAFPAAIDPTKNCHVALLKGLKRSWKAGMTDIRDYDDFILTIDNASREDAIASLLVDFTGPANITGLCPMLCDEAGRPTGFPVQLSKNWHATQLGSYLRAYLRVPAKPGTSRFLFRVVYGFYGNVPSASHAQLSLIGYGGNARWDQMAIGCWGETFCLDMDMSLVDVAITDVRSLMVRKGAQGQSWNWTDSAWGGDWLSVRDRQDQKLYFAGLKTAYVAHGPCLSDVRYNGHYGAKHEVDLAANVQTLRTDDYARTFHRLSYTFREALPAKNSALFKMGRTSGLVTPKIAYGNAAGLLAEKDVPPTVKADDVFLETTTLTGDGPWWVAFPGAHHPGGRMPDGSRALIVRSYKATFGGKTYREPTICMSAYSAQNVDLLLVPPKDVETYQPGDSVELDLEWITLPRAADDYYGPNESFRRHLAENPDSWKTVHREARGNDFRVAVDGGTLLSRYPIAVRVQKPEVKVEITGGVGFVPIRFEGLDRPTGWSLYRVEAGKETKLDQSRRGNDYWQADYEVRSGTFKLTFNLPLDKSERSTWLLKPDAEKASSR